MSSYFNLIPNELLYTIIYYIEDKYVLNKLISSIDQLTAYFSDENNWKDMLYFIYKNPVINLDHTWRDNYLDNMNIKDKYNLEIINTSPKSYKYAIFFRDITGDKQRIENDVDNIREGYDDYVGQSNDYISIITNLKDYVRRADNDHLIYAKMVDFVEKQLKINHPYIIFHVDLMDIYSLSDLLNNYTIYGPKFNLSNIIKTKIDDIDIILVDAPELSYDL